MNRLPRWLRLAVLPLLAILWTTKGLDLMSPNHSTASPLKSDPHVRFAFPSNQGTTTYDPANIRTCPEYTVIEHLYSPLIEVRPTGELAPGVAEEFTWEENTAVFKIRETLRTISGTRITAEDVVFSLKRLLILNSNTHGSLAHQLCGTTELKSLTEPCHGIQISGNTVRLEFPEPNESLFRMLAAIDFAVLSRSSVDPMNLQIINTQETSGPYYVKTDAPSIILAANPTHYLYDPLMPQSIELTHVPSSAEAVALFLRNGLDVLSTDAASTQDILGLEEAAKQSYTLHETLPIRTYGLFQDDITLAHSTLEERVAIGRALKPVLYELLSRNQNRVSLSKQVFPPTGDGSLPSNELEALHQGLSVPSADSIQWNQVHLTIGRVGDVAEFSARLSREFPDIHIHADNVLRALKPLADQKENFAAFTLSAPDFGYFENISLLAYSLSAQMFLNNAAEREQWMKRFTRIQDPIRRIDQIRAIHKDALASARAIPIAQAPYVTWVQNRWASNFSKFYSNTQLWLMRLHSSNGP